MSRSYQYEKRRGIVRVRYYRKADDERYLVLIRQICDERPTYGYRRVTAILNRVLREGGEPGVNHKRVYRIMKIHDLLLQRHTGRPARLHEGTVITLRSNIRWCSDVFEIACWNGERVRVAFSMDCADWMSAPPLITARNPTGWPRPSSRLSSETMSVCMNYLMP